MCQVGLALDGRCAGVAAKMSEVRSTGLACPQLLVHQLCHRASLWSHHSMPEHARACQRAEHASRLGRATVQKGSGLKYNFGSFIASVTLAPSALAAAAAPLRLGWTLAAAPALALALALAPAAATAGNISNSALPTGHSDVQTVGALTFGSYSCPWPCFCCGCGCGSCSCSWTCSCSGSSSCGHGCGCLRTSNQVESVIALSACDWESGSGQQRAADARLRRRPLLRLRLRRGRRSRLRLRLRRRRSRLPANIESESTLSL